MAGQHHKRNEDELRQTPRNGEARGGLACCSPCGHKELDVTGKLNDTTMCTGSAISNPVTTWAVAHQAPQSMGFPRQEQWSGLLVPSPGDLPNAGIELATLISLALASGFFATSPTWEARDDSCIMMHNYFRRKLQHS